MEKNGPVVAEVAKPSSKRQNSVSAPSPSSREANKTDQKNAKSQPASSKSPNSNDAKSKDSAPEEQQPADISTAEPSLVIDKFRVDPSKVLGEGSYASVCLATHVENGKTYACKMINDKKNMGNFIERFLPRELKLMRKFNSERVTCVYGIFKTHNLFYIFMDHCENGDLLRYLQRRGRALDEDETREKSLQIMLAVRYLHEEQQVAHRDLKCENILIDSNFKLKLGDFGFARSVLPVADNDAEQMEIRNIKEFMSSDVSSLPCFKLPPRSRRASEKAATSAEIAKLDKLPTASGSNGRLSNGNVKSSTQAPVASSTFCGSVAYAAPEVLSRKTYDPKKYDMWSAGVIVFIMACFFMPFDDSDQTKMVRRQMAKKWRYPQETQISDSLKEFLEGMMEPNPKDRYSVGEALKHKWLRRLYREVLVEEQKADQSK